MKKNNIVWIPVWFSFFVVVICAICELLYDAVVEKITGKKHNKDSVYKFHSKEVKHG
jgi:hypothetical protein